MDNQQNWKRLGSLLAERREELGWPKRNPFAAQHQTLSSRIFYDVEKAKRTNFDRATIAQLEVAYQWDRGSIESVLRGGEPTPIEAPSSPDVGEGYFVPIDANKLTMVDESDTDEIVAYLVSQAYIKINEIEDRKLRMSVARKASELHNKTDNDYGETQ